MIENCSYITYVFRRHVDVLNCSVRDRHTHRHTTRERHTKKYKYTHTHTIMRNYENRKTFCLFLFLSSWHSYANSEKPFTIRPWFKRSGLTRRTLTVKAGFIEVTRIPCDRVTKQCAMKQTCRTMNLWLYSKLRTRSNDLRN